MAHSFTGISLCFRQIQHIDEFIGELNPSSYKMGNNLRQQHLSSEKVPSHFVSVPCELRRQEQREGG